MRGAIACAVGSNFGGRGQDAVVPLGPHQLAEPFSSKSASCCLQSRLHFTHTLKLFRDSSYSSEEAVNIKR